MQIDWGNIGEVGDANNGDIDFGDDINFDMSEITIDSGGSGVEADNSVSRTYIFITTYNPYLLLRGFVFNQLIWKIFFV